MKKLLTDIVREDGKLDFGELNKFECIKHTFEFLFDSFFIVSGDFERFQMGDSVALLPQGKTAIVYRPTDDDGNVVIQIQGAKMTVRHDRLKLLVPAAQLYPPDYDFSIIFDTVANRKAAHTLARKHDPNAVVVVREGRPDQ